ncbi:MAG: hypothetical protein IID28_11000 [Planctomycetes bacterium]|nr:hypothetical protein [Planctomycetota bacterium]
MRKAAAMRDIRCYLCGYRLTVSMRAMSTSCPSCKKAIKIEDVIVKTYIPVIDLQTCGRIKITKRGRVAAKRIQSGDGITCDGVMEGAVETDGDVDFGPKASWKGSTLLSRSIRIAAGAKLIGVVTVPWQRPEPVKKKKTVAKTTTAKKTVTKKTLTKKTTVKKKTAKKTVRKKKR